MMIGVTGSHGYLGNALIEVAREKKYKIVSVELPHTSEIKDINFLVDILGALKCSYLIHTAAVKKPRNELHYYVNAELPLCLAKAFKIVNPSGLFCHISTINVLISSINDNYTISKRDAEQRLKSQDVIIIRPAIFWDYDRKGYATRFEEFVKRFPFMLYPGRKYQPIKPRDLSERILDELDGFKDNTVINVIGDSTYTLWELAKYYVSKKKHLIPIPSLPDMSIFPKFLRSIDYTVLSYSNFKQADETWILSFDLMD